MAGYLFTLDSEESLINCIATGSYSTRVASPRPNNTHQTSVEGTFADYASMKAGDNVYFFIDRKIYGVGELVNIDERCKYLNYPEANHPTTQNYFEIRDLLLLDTGEESINQRFICFFRPTPHFFQEGIDMDEMLGSAPDKFKILRVFWKLSFIKFSDEENQAFKDLILRRNEIFLTQDTNDNIFNTNYNEFHQEVLGKIQLRNYRLHISPLLTSVRSQANEIGHEMAIEAALIYQLSEGVENSITVFGGWDYLTHQVVASPFKPVDYMDKMDVFGYSFIDGQAPTISKFLIIEIKRGRVNTPDVLQLMKYVDWIKNEYAYGDYSMIDAFLVGASFNANVAEELPAIQERNFIKGFRPAVSTKWENLKLVQYRYNEDNQILDFNLVEP